MKSQVPRDQPQFIRDFCIEKSIDQDFVMSKSVPQITLILRSETLYRTHLLIP